MLQDLAALTPPLIVCVAFLIGVGFLVRRELAPKRRAARAAAGSPPASTRPVTIDSVSAALDGADLDGADLDGADLDGADLDGAALDGTERAAAQRLRPGPAAAREGSAPREAETAPDRGDGSQT
jgi:hypothetical protein